MKSVCIRIINILLILTFLSSKAEARVIGGHLGYTHIGTDSFLVKLTLYRDCNTIYFSNVEVKVKCASSGTILNTLTLIKPAAIDITPICGNSCTRCDSLGCTYPYGIEKYEYTAIADISNAGSCCDIIFEFQDYIRAAGITTGPAGSVFYINAYLNRCLAPDNSSPEYSYDPVKIVCIGHDFSFNPEIKDPDLDQNAKPLDSLGFSWTTPMVNDSVPVIWGGNYTYDKPIFFWGFPNANLPFPRGFHLNKQNGTILLRPMKLEQSIMTMKITEWRSINGVRTRIGESNMEMNIIVIACPDNNPPVVKGPFYKEVCANDTVFFTIQTNDYDSLDTLTISWNNAIPGANWTDNNGEVKHPTGVLTWVPGEQHASPVPYIFTVTVKDNACPVSGSSTRAYQILVKPRPRARITVVDSGCGNYYLYAQAILGSSPSFQWEGNFNPGFAFQGTYMHYKFNQSGTYPYTLTMKAHGCSRTYYDTIVTDSFLSLYLTPDHSVCVGDSTYLTALYEHNKGNVSFLWSNGDSNQSFTLIVSKDTSFSVEISDSSQCIAYGKVNINVQKAPDFYLNTPDNIRSFCTGLGLIPLTVFPKGGNLTGPFSFDNYFNADTSEGAYTFVYIYADSLGCGFSDTILIETGTPFISIIKEDSVFCQGEAIRLRGLVKNVHQLLWSTAADADGYFESPAVLLNANYITGTNDMLQKRVKFYLSNLDSACLQKKDSILIRLLESPIVDFTAMSTQYYPVGDYFRVQFYDQSTVPNPPASYHWDFGNKISSQLQHPLVNLYNHGYHSVVLTVKDRNNCETSRNKENYIHLSGIEKTAESDRLVIFPNPTDNELFIKSSFIIKEIRLINSVGKVVWHERDLNTMEHKLDGRQKGFYLLEITDILGVKHIQKLIFY